MSFPESGRFSTVNTKTGEAEEVNPMAVSSTALVTKRDLRLQMKLLQEQLAAMESPRAPPTPVARGLPSKRARANNPNSEEEEQDEEEENNGASSLNSGACCPTLVLSDHLKQKSVFVRFGIKMTRVESGRSAWPDADHGVRGNEGVVRGNEGGRDRSHGRDRGNARAQVRGNYTSHEVSPHSHAPVVGTSAPVVGKIAPVMGTQLLYAPTWAEDFESFMVGKAPGTLRKYQRHFDVLVLMLEKHQLYNTPPNDITTRHLKELAVTAKEVASSENVARDIIGFIMNFWTYLFTEEKVDRDRGTVLTKLKPKKQPTQMVERSLTREECELMYTTAKGLGPYDTALFVCTYMAGQRRFEAAKLRANECTYNNDNTINLRFKGKGGKVRTVPLNIEATRDIEPFLKAAMTESGQANGGWLFPGAIKGQHICNDTVYNHIKKLGKLSGLEEKYGCPITTHWMRHCFGSHAIQGGADPATVSKQMGHASIATTSQYLHANKNKAASDYLEFTAEERKERKERKMKKKKKKEEERDDPLILWRTNYIKLKREEAKQRYKQLKQEGADDEMVAQAKASYKSFPKH